MSLLLIAQVFYIAIALECNQTQYIKNGICVDCEKGCKKCENEIGCVSCEDKYYFLSNKCLRCDSHCDSTCEDGYGCKTCMPTYTEKNGKCIAPPCPFCAENSCNVTTCSLCIENYYVSKGKCVLCDKNCKNCDIDGCVECKLDYHVLNGRCQANTLSSRDIIFISIGSLLGFVMCLCFMMIGISYIKGIFKQAFFNEA
ncbi:CXXC-rich, putative [Entamoeba histolytica HM-1:IMSS-B]|uniref:CXXC-rich protein n=6 Tax=Entamoeba histolytica TaxID=5759 RepID=C4M0P3_ENTH1|nr:CXXC-rich protein [Entamoeba histolytica HM-1:IMSS]EMD45652.1 CXXC-rich protein, putative [Entamoeba histolytica KU27]EMH75379.1 CXXC-rich, putative [Entamoeba histolytica HM-1:IMSS-B]EMS11440.1 CXXC-rich protein [Entamoeba histolytica HM-3:IMSS]ENY65171.1 CXXC-rich protein, putative [Entamoeba histolytica HM-1:IMSS-A]GAT94740.1 cxxc-rich protein [Entamoeba histolytica]|eukprot:XP_652979.1 CXXC-rich protein [Entamoeba histolytica HM-1:IMSS]